jgi:hypothetical protein
MTINDTHRSEAFQLEAQGLFAAYDDHGFERPPELTATALLMGTCKAFVPDQMPSAYTLKDLTPRSQQYFANVVQPDLAYGARRQNPQTLALAHQAGRAFGSAGLSGEIITFNPPLELGPQEIEADGHRIPYSIETGQVIEYGMGINGLFTHLQNVQAGRYQVYGVHRGRSEVAVLQGICDYYGIAEDKVSLAYQGIARHVAEKLKTAKEPADLVVASRVHMAGRELRYGIDKSAGLLRTGGLLVARGPQVDEGGMGYNQVGRCIESNRKLKTMLDVDYRNPHVPKGIIEPNRLIVAQKIER